MASRCAISFPPSPLHSAKRFIYSVRSDYYELQRIWIINSRTMWRTARVDEWMKMEQLLAQKHPDRMNNNLMFNKNLWQPDGPREGKFCSKTLWMFMQIAAHSRSNSIRFFTAHSATFFIPPRSRNCSSHADGHLTLEFPFMPVAIRLRDDIECIASEWIKSFQSLH